MLEVQVALGFGELVCLLLQMLLGSSTLGGWGHRWTLTVLLCPRQLNGAPLRGVPISSVVQIEV
jgi:hypothetical protein